MERAGVAGKQLCGCKPSAVEPVHAGEKGYFEGGLDGFKIAGALARGFGGFDDAPLEIRFVGRLFAAAGERSRDDFAVVGERGEGNGFKGKGFLGRGCCGCGGGFAGAVRRLMEIFVVVVHVCAHGLHISF